MNNSCHDLFTLVLSAENAVSLTADLVTLAEFNSDWTILHTAGIWDGRWHRYASI